MVDRPDKEALLAQIWRLREKNGELEKRNKELQERNAELEGKLEEAGSYKNFIEQIAIRERTTRRKREELIHSLQGRNVDLSTEAGELRARLEELERSNERLATENQAFKARVRAA